MGKREQRELLDIEWVKIGSEIWQSLGMSIQEPRDQQHAIEILGEARSILSESKYESMCEELDRIVLARPHIASVEASVVGEKILSAPLHKAILMAGGTDSLSSGSISALIELNRIAGVAGVERGAAHMGSSALEMPELVIPFESDDRPVTSFQDARPEDVTGSVAWSYMYPTISLYGRFGIAAISEHVPRKLDMQWAQRAFVLRQTFPRGKVLRVAAFKFGYLNNRFFCDPRNPPISESSVFVEQIRYMFGRKFCAQYEWMADVEAGGLLRGFRIPTTPHAALALFRSRSSFPSHMRKRALLHWVCAHRRRKRSGADAEVRRHLRGVREFSWNGMRVMLHPSSMEMS